MPKKRDLVEDSIYFLFLNTLHIVVQAINDFFCSECILGCKKRKNGVNLYNGILDLRIYMT